MNYFCIQTTKKACGFACVKMLLANTLKNPDYLYLDEDLDHNYYSMNDLIKIAKDEGVNLDGYEITSINKNTLLTPCIGLINSDNKKHYVYIYKLEKDMLYFYDPSGEEKVMMVEDFESISENKFLLIKSVEKKQNKFKANNPVKLPFYELSQYAISLLQCISIFLLSFLSQNGSILVFVSIGIFLMSVFLSHYVRVFFLKEFDKKFINPILEEEKCTTEDITSAFELKKLYFSRSNKMLLDSLVLGFSIFILSVNDIKCLICIAIIIIVKLISDNILKKKNLLLKNEINTLEKAGDATSFKNANTKSYEYLENVQFYSILNIIIVLFITFIICFINNNFGQFIVIFILFLIAQDKIEKIITHEEGKIIFNKYECLYKSLINKNGK